MMLQKDRRLVLKIEDLLSPNSMICLLYAVCECRMKKKCTNANRADGILLLLTTIPRSKNDLLAPVKITII